MPRYVYDDFRITFGAGADARYPIRADHADRHWTGWFTLPMPLGELEQAVLAVARGGHGGRTTRDVGASFRSEVDAATIGSQLAGALLSGEIGEAYATALQAVDRRDGRGLRLTLSLAETPELLSIPWELLYRRPTFLAVQPHLPLVRHVEVGPIVDPPVIDDAVRILGVVASPHDLPALDVSAERQRVEQAVAAMRSTGRVVLDWLQPATPRRLREALRDHQYHAIHYVGHSSFGTDGDGPGEGVLYLEHPADGRATPLDSTMLANLLGDQVQLQLVVLNSCEGARTTLTDPFAGVATTLIQSGVPAVVAMQFEISDAAAIVFAEELYTNLIARQDPIDAAVAEARKAVFVEVDELEWATPVLFLRDPAITLFSFQVDAAALPATAPMELLIPSVSPFLAVAATSVAASTQVSAAGPWPPPPAPGPGPGLTLADVI
ncbi:MAG: CHAT domain-containing protein [Ilumatobacteraceae bacterium]